jgi:DNA (cytosine-5)-methyltransferase 1
MGTPRLLDLFCGAGGAAMGYHRAGFEVVGVDIKPQPHYPFEFYQRDIRTFDQFDILGFMADAVHASPPCQHYANVTRWRGTQANHPALIAPTRSFLVASGLPWVIENVENTPIQPHYSLCGSMFGLPIRRHRWFETSAPLRMAPMNCRHSPDDLAFEHKQERAYADAMGCDWMSAREAREAIPPAYTEYIGGWLMGVLSERIAA